MTCLNFRAFLGLPLLLCSTAFAQNGALRIVEPIAKKGHTIVTSEPAITLRGTLVWKGGDTRILWKNYRGFSDLMSVTISQDNRTVLWHTTTPTPLRPGVNHIQIEALGQPGAADFVNIYYMAPKTTSDAMGSAILHGQQITYEVRNGLAVYQGDMILGEEADAVRGRFLGRFGGAGMLPQSATITPNPAYASGLWPIVNGVVRVPYTMTSVNATNIDAAIADSNSQLAGVVQWVAATGGDVNLVNFNFNASDQSGTCEAVVGMEGGTQPIGGSETCGVVTILHEMGHALGLYHEQSRPDRNTWVNYSESNVDKPQAANFDILQALVPSGLYNYASIMEYGPFSFSRYGTLPVLETIPAGMVLGTDLPEYTTGDLDGIKRLYGFTPTAVTVDTNPSGLNVVVDGTACTAPCVFTTWTIGSQHTLAVPLDSNNQTLQILSQQPYIFGRWNSDVNNTQASSVTVTNSAGTGTLLSPRTAPAITAYLASFIPVHPYKPVVHPAGAATISASPTPKTLIINGTSTSYYTDRQPINLTVQANNGYTFYEWANVALYSFYDPNYNFDIISNFDYLNFNTSDPVTAYLVTDPVLTLRGAAPDIGSFDPYPGFAIGVVENSNSNATTFASTPANFDASFDGNGFRAGSSLTLCASGLNGTSCPGTAPTQSPVTTNITYSFSSWTGYAGGSSNAVTLTMPSSSQEVTAEYTPSFRVIVLPSPYCTAAGLSVNTSSAVASSNLDGGLDAFFRTGPQTFVANPGSSGMDFVQWTGDLTGSSNDYQQTLQGELIATANFNFPGTTLPLTVTGVSPSTPTVTNSATTLSVTGTGFSTNDSSGYFGVGSEHFDGRTTTVQSPTLLTMQLQAGDLASVGYNQILIQNSAGGSCSVQTVFTFPVASAPLTLQSIGVSAPSLSIAKGLTDQFTATGNYSDGSTQNLTAQVIWTSANTAAATIVASGANAGLASAAGVGSSKITATLNSVSGNATLTVTAPTLVSITVTPANPSIIAGGTEQFTATGTYTDNSTQNLTASVTWASSNTGVATIVASGANAGKATGAAGGSSTISATSTTPAVAGSTTLAVPLGPCDVNPDGHYTVVDVQTMVNEALGKWQPSNDLNGDKVVNVMDIQIVINAVLSSVCSAS